MNKRIALSLLTIGTFGLLAAATTDSPSSSTSSSSTAPKVPDAQCKQDLACWAERHQVGATVRCTRVVERLAKNDFEWTDGMLEPKFSHYRWKDQAKGVVTYIGDRIKYQNGFGAWIHHTYECDYQPDGEVVLDARASPGRLP